MNSTVRDLAQKAGFSFWEDESWGPGPGHIDWSCDYDSEFEAFVALLADHVAQQAALIQSQTVKNGTQDYNTGRAMGAEVLKNIIVEDLTGSD